MPEGAASTGKQAAMAVPAAVLEKLRPSLVRFFERRWRHSADVEDLVQEVFLHLARQVDPAAIEQPERYVFRIATNVMRDRLRRGVVRRSGAHVPIDDLEVGGEAPSAERVYQSEKLLEQVLAVLEELTPKCRTTFLLQRFEGLSYSQIARRLGVSRSAIEKQMMHVIQVLSKHFPE